MNIQQTNIRSFLDNCPPNYDFPYGGSHSLLTPEEQILLKDFQSEMAASEIKETSRSLTLRESYLITIFAMRSVVYAAEQKSPRLLAPAMIALSLGAPQIDWRDFLSALAILEHYSNKMGSSQAVEIFSSDFTLNAESQSVIKSYLNRPLEMRTLISFGVIEF